MVKRCQWCGDDPLYVSYHDEEWGVPVYDDRTFYEFLLLEGAQAGLAWITVLRKREGYRSLFAGFDPARVARYPDARLEKLLGDERIIRNRLKVYSARQNARAFLQVQEEWGSFSDYIWHFTDGSAIQGDRGDPSAVPARTELSDAISRDLKRRGFNFVGSTIVYAFLQATGIVNDHLRDCYRYEACKKLAR
jgi:DNA-3-methyladenine glycosylase I